MGFSVLATAKEIFERKLEAGNRQLVSGDYHGAIASYLAARDISPDAVGARENLGMVYTRLGQLDMAQTYFQQALQQNGESLVNCNGLANVKLLQGDVMEAAFWYRRALALFCTDEQQRQYLEFNLAQALLLAGDWQEGLSLFESRRRHPLWATRYQPFEKLEQLEWRGENFSGRTLLIYQDLGYGDAMQFWRFIPQVKRCGGQIVLAVKAPLVRLAAACPGVDCVVIMPDQGLPECCYDLHLPLTSLAMVLKLKGTELLPAAPRPMIPPDAEERCRRLGLSSIREFKVGLVWSAEPNWSPTDLRGRSARLADFAPLFEISGITLCSLQVGDAACEIRQLPNLVLIDAMAEVRDFADTAAVITQLDLVIGVDTAVVHLAAACGGEVWTLLPSAPDWRWRLETESTPWYPTMRLWRRGGNEEWSSLVARVATALSERINSSGATTALEKKEDAQSPPADLPPVAADHNQCGIDWAQQGRNKEAAACFAAAVEAYPDFVEAWNNWGLVLLAANDPMALSRFEKALALNPDDADIHSNLGNALSAFGRTKDAICHYLRAIELCPGNGRAHNNLAETLKSCGRMEEAAVQYQAARQLLPDNPVIGSNWLMALHYIGND
ncbi:MAG TPA: tetratricopeptide repeat protein [Patescibacteria group bacterium]|nr:tetratricopeptide repeat protein [Patescibacteria group bacterium]